MNCPNCNSEITSNRCHNCGIDVTLFDKTNTKSNIFYNKALTLAMNGDLSGATDHLIKSLEFNKKNIDARNLLGLCYSETGRFGEALKQWVISLNYKKTDNLADDYLNLFQKNQRTLDGYAESITMYNDALQYMHQQSEDMAIIRLKKATDINPNFVDAHNLLALCYLIQNDKTKAAGAAEKALAIDAHNAIAENYYKEIFPGRQRASNQPRSGSVQNKNSASPAVKVENRVPSYNPYAAKQQKAFSSGLPISEIFCFIIGAVCMLLLMYILIMPAAAEDQKLEIAALNNKIVTMQTAFDAQISGKNSEIEALNTDKAELLTQTITQQDNLDSLMNVQKVSTAHSYFQQGKVEEALLMLDAISLTDLTPDMTETYNYIKTEAYPILEKKYYDEGESLFNAKNYTEAKAAFEKALKYPSADSAVTDDIFYYLGRLAELDNDKALAKSYYENIINNYTKSNRLSTVKTRIKSLG